MGAGGKRKLVHSGNLRRSILGTIYTLYSKDGSLVVNISSFVEERVEH